MHSDNLTKQTSKIISEKIIFRSFYVEKTFYRCNLKLKKYLIVKSVLKKSNSVGNVNITQKRFDFDGTNFKNRMIKFDILCREELLKV